MKLTYRLWSAILLFTFVVIKHGFTEDIVPKLTVHYFGSSTCGECQEIKEAILNPLQEMNAEKLNLELHDIDNDDDFQLLIKYENHFKIGAGSPQTLILPDTFLLGFDDIMANGTDLIEAYIKDPSKWKAADLSINKDTTISHKTFEERYAPRPTTLFEYVRDLGFFCIGILCFLFRKKRIAIIVAQLAAGIVFLLASFSKLGNPHELAIIIKAYGILPDTLSNLAAYIMPWIELISGISLIIGIFPQIGAGFIFVMNIVFIPALLYRTINEAAANAVSIFKVGFDCGCGLGENLAWVLIVRDIGFVLMTLAVIRHLALAWNSIETFKQQK